MCVRQTNNFESLPNHKRQRGNELSDLKQHCDMRPRLPCHAIQVGVRCDFVIADHREAF
ncbi:hypothetical protein LP7551_04744 [Roseibium album]|nr:hypothetical protein LP7551_04744 [Roseibium album]